MAWTAEDVAMLLQEMAGFDPTDPTSADVPVPDYQAGIGGRIEGLRIGVVRHFFEVDKPVSAEVAREIEASLSIFRAQGAIVRDVALSPLGKYSAANRVIVHYEAASAHREWLRSRPHDYGHRMRNRMVLAGMLTGADYIQALQCRRRLCLELKAMMASFDLLVSASAAGEAPLMAGIPLWDGLLSANFSSPWSQAGYPAIAVSTGFGPAQMPIGVQLGGKPFEEATLLRAAHILERETCSRAKRPPGTA